MNMKVMICSDMKVWQKATNNGNTHLPRT